MSWALSVTGVKNVWVNDTLPRGQGTVDVYILGESGIPPPALIDLISPPQDLGIAPYEFPVSGAVTLTFGAPVDG